MRPTEHQLHGGKRCTPNDHASVLPKRFRVCGNDFRFRHSDTRRRQSKDGLPNKSLASWLKQTRPKRSRQRSTATLPSLRTTAVELHTSQRDDHEPIAALSTLLQGGNRRIPKDPAISLTGAPPPTPRLQDSSVRSPRSSQRSVRRFRAPVQSSPARVRLDRTCPVHSRPVAPGDVRLSRELPRQILEPPQSRTCGRQTTTAPASTKHLLGYAQLSLVVAGE